jgi:site-specific recombinase XerD
MSDQTPLSLEAAKENFVSYLKDKGRASATILAYGKDIAQLAEFATNRGRQAVTDLNAEDIEAFKTFLKSQNYTAKSISRKVNSIKSFCRFLKSQGLISDNPASQVTHPKYEVSPPRILTKMEYRALRDAARADQRLSAIIELLLQTGMRIGELANLTLEDLNLENKQVKIRAYESHDSRDVPLTEAAIKSLESYLNIRPKTKEKTIFITKTGNPFLVRNIRTAIDRYFKLAGISDAKVNDLRHTFIAQQLAAGTPLLYVSKLVGHKRLSTTEKYLKFVEEKSPKDSVKLEEL